MKNLSLYIHIPFCESKCDYCSFVSCKASIEEKEKYVQYLLKEIRLRSNKNFLVKTIFIGGGTPSCLENNQITKILKEIYAYFNVDTNAEITIEANPNSFSRKKAKEYKKAGINRLSFGLQSANDNLLQSVNRLHNKKEFIKAVKIAKRLKFKNINADMLIGLPSQELKDVIETLNLLIKLKIPHISCYSLILEENTRLFENVNKGYLNLPSEDETIEMYDYVLDFLKKYDINRYEVSNFAKSSFECKHNLVYWNLGDYLGLGLNSHSKINNERLENYSCFNDYYKSLDKNKLPIKNKETIFLKTKQEEYLMLGLRKQEGINLEDFEKEFKCCLDVEKAKEIDFLKQNNLIKIEKGYLFATDLGFKVLNSVILKLI